MGVSCQKNRVMYGSVNSRWSRHLFFKVWGSGLTEEVKAFLLSMAAVSLTSVNCEMLFFSKNKRSHRPPLGKEGREIVH